MIQVACDVKIFQKSVHPNYSALEALEKKEGTIDFAFQEGQLYEKQLHPALVWSLESVKIYANFSGEIVSFQSPGRFDMHCVGNRNPNENVQSMIMRTDLIFYYVKFIQSCGAHFISSKRCSTKDLEPMRYSQALF